MTVASTSPRKPIVLWRPRMLIDRVAGSTLDQFVEAHSGGYFLVVRLDAFSSELAAGLDGQDVPAATVRARRATISLGLPSIGDTTDLALGGSIAPPRPVVQSSQQCPAELLSSECYVVAVRQRTSADRLVSRVSIGREPYHDIPLRHPSVSRLHAHIDLGGGLSVTDSGSSNHTFVNGEPVRDRADLKPGDLLKFGAVQCCLVSASGLWRAVHG